MTVEDLAGNAGRSGIEVKPRAPDADVDATPTNGRFPAGVEEQKLLVEIWKKTVDVQQHFNDLQLRIRNYAVTVLVAASGAAAVAMKDQSSLAIANRRVALASVLLTAGLAGWGAFYFMDAHWYHRYLKGAVKHGMEIEKADPRLSNAMRLAGAISDASGSKRTWLRLRSTQRVGLFYGSVAILLVVLAAASQCALGTPRPEQVTLTTSNIKEVRVVMVERIDASVGP